MQKNSTSANETMVLFRVVVICMPSGNWGTLGPLSYILNSFVVKRNKIIMTWAHHALYIYKFFGPQIIGLFEEKYEKPNCKNTVWCQPCFMTHMTLLGFLAMLCGTSVSFSFITRISTSNYNISMLFNC